MRDDDIDVLEDEDADLPDNEDGVRHCGHARPVGSPWCYGCQRKARDLLRRVSACYDNINPVAWPSWAGDVREFLDGLKED